MQKGKDMLTSHRKRCQRKLGKLKYVYKQENKIAQINKL